MSRIIEKFDKATIAFLKKITFPLGRTSLFMVFFWFGLLKIINTSPANPLVEQLLNKTLHFLKVTHESMRNFSINLQSIIILFLGSQEVEIIN